MVPSYSVIADTHRSLLRLAPSGFFDRATAERFRADRDAAVNRMRCGRNQHVTLVDIREQMISTPEIAASFKEMIGDPRFAARKLAFVVTAALARAQTQRVAQRENVAYFTDVATAEAWLFADDAAPEAPRPAHVEA